MGDREQPIYIEANLTQFERDAGTRAPSKMLRETESSKISHEVLSECGASSHRF
jgi:hypothetical protein